MMKKYIFLFVLSALFMGGCAVSTGDKKPFPAEAVGIWKCENQEDLWIEIDEQGNIPRVIHYISGPINASDGGVEMEGPDKGTNALFLLGDCTAKYNKWNRNLSVVITLDRFEMNLPQGSLVGDCEDHFDGKIAKDGKTWTAKWWAFANLEGADAPDRKMIEDNPETVVFRKISMEEIKKEVESNTLRFVDESGLGQEVQENEEGQGN